MYRRSFGVPYMCVYVFSACVFLCVFSVSLAGGRRKGAILHTVHHQGSFVDTRFCFNSSCYCALYMLRCEGAVGVGTDLFGLDGVGTKASTADGWDE